MIPQQVNFYHDIYRPRFDPLAPRTMVQIALGLLGLLLCSAGVLNWQLSSERSQLQRLRTNKDAATARVEELGTRYPARAATQALSQNIASLEREKSRKSSMMALLDEGKINKTSGFAQIFRELAIARTEGVWLTGIGVFDAGQHLLIEGSANPAGADRIAGLIQAITQRPLFAGKTFGHLRMQSVKDQKDQKDQKDHSELLHFQLKSDPERSLERFWEKKEEEKEPAVVQKANKAIRESRKEMQKAGDPLQMNPPKDNKAAKP
ncbi:MAG: hypothetical protein HQL91_03830 [Magnetococcales bacterium]|nr:hypothetical protein [Magnetococcales bacterium]